VGVKGYGVAGWFGRWVVPQRNEQMSPIGWKTRGGAETGGGGVMTCRDSKGGYVA